MLDADVIVFANEYGVWGQLKASYDIHVPATVIDEAKFFESNDTRKRIDLKAEEKAGQIKRSESTAIDIQETFENFEATFLAALQDGEKEGITILREKSESGMVFCTGDTAAIQAVGMIGLGDACISFEKMLEFAGTPKLIRPLLPSLTEKSHCFHLKRGKERRVTGECFKKNPLGI